MYIPTNLIHNIFFFRHIIFLILLLTPNNFIIYITCFQFFQIFSIYLFFYLLFPCFPFIIISSIFWTAADDACAEAAVNLTADSRPQEHVPDTISFTSFISCYLYICIYLISSNYINCVKVLLLFV